MEKETQEGNFCVTCGWLSWIEMVPSELWTLHRN